MKDIRLGDSVTVVTQSGTVHQVVVDDIDLDNGMFYGSKASGEIKMGTWLEIKDIIH